MVKGDWIVNIRDMRCKNWVNGIEVVFYLNREKMLVGKIQHIPEKLIKGKSPAIELVSYLHKMWNRAASIFYRAYYRQRGSKIVPEYPRWIESYGSCFHLDVPPQTGGRVHGLIPQSLRSKHRTDLKFRGRK
jgi:hypothetical protein